MISLKRLQQHRFGISRIFKRLYSTPEIPLGPEEDPGIHKGVIWFDSLFPYQKPIFDPRNYFINQHVNSVKNDFSKYIPIRFPGDADFKVVNIQENLKEGIYKFKKGGTIEEALETIQHHLKEAKVRGLLGLGKVHAFQVKGNPWVEDLVSRVPSSELHVEFHGPDLTVESLFREFRVFGRIMDIALQPSSSKDTPRFATVRFLNKRSATSARNCIHGEQFGETRLAIGYEKNKSYWHHIWSWVTGNLRISIPLILALFAAITFAVFDPWRIFSITNQITGRYNIYSAYEKTATKWWNLLKTLLDNAFNIPHPVSEPPMTKSEHWNEREIQSQRLRDLLKQSPESITLISGPKGSGKSGFVEQTIMQKRNKLIIRCDELVGKGDYQLLSHLSSQVNFFPTFGFLAQVGGIVDTIITASTGAKANIAPTHEGEIAKVLECLALALEGITETQKQKRQKLRGQLKADGIENLLDDIDYPVVIIDDYLGKENIREQHIYQTLAQWSAQVAENRIAHVIFVSDNPSALQALGKVLTKSAELYHLADATPSGSVSYVKKRLGQNFNTDSIQKCIVGLGGRLNDLDLFVTKIQTGMAPDVAFNEMVRRAITELRKNGLLDDPNQKQQWSAIQFWKVVQLLSKFKQVSFDELVVHPLFASDPQPLLHMERSGLITLVRQHDRPYYVKPGRPIFTTAFQEMKKDEKLDSYMGILTAKYLYNENTKKIRDFEQELSSLIDDNGWFQSGVDERRKWITETIGYYSKKAQMYFETEEKLKKKLKLAE